MIPQNAMDKVSTPYRIRHWSELPDGWDEWRVIGVSTQTTMDMIIVSPNHIWLVSIAGVVNYRVNLGISIDSQMMEPFLYGLGPPYSRSWWRSSVAGLILARPSWKLPNLEKAKQYIMKLVLEPIILGFVLGVTVWNYANLPIRSNWWS